MGGYCELYGHQQVIRLKREPYDIKKDKTSHEVVYCLTSLITDEAGPEPLLALVRNRWHIENRLHYVRNFTDDENRGRFPHVPSANRH